MLQGACIIPSKILLAFGAAKCPLAQVPADAIAYYNTLYVRNSAVNIYDC